MFETLTANTLGLNFALTDLLSFMEYVLLKWMRGHDHNKDNLAP